MAAAAWESFPFFWKPRPRRRAANRRKGRPSRTRSRHSPPQPIVDTRRLPRSAHGRPSESNGPRIKRNAFRAARVFVLLSTSPLLHQRRQGAGAGDQALSGSSDEGGGDDRSQTIAATLAQDRVRGSANSIAKFLTTEHRR